MPGEAAVSQTESVQNGGNGFSVGSAGVIAALTVDASAASNNNQGFAAVGSGATALVSHTAITENSTGVSQTNPGRVFSYQDNLLDGNSATGHDSNNGAYATAPLR